MASLLSAASSSPPNLGNLVFMTLGVGSLECELQVSILLPSTAAKLKVMPFATFEEFTGTPNLKPGDGEYAPNLNFVGKERIGGCTREGKKKFPVSSQLNLWALKLVAEVRIGCCSLKF